MARLVLAGLVLAVAVGCAADDPLRGQEVIACPAAATPTVRPAPHSADYELWVNDTAEPVRQAYAYRDDPIGFGRDASGGLVAIVGPTTLPLDGRHPYAWHLLRGGTIDDRFSLGNPGLEIGRVMIQAVVQGGLRYLASRSGGSRL